MLDGRLVRMIVFCFVFLGSFVTLLALIPPQYSVVTKQYSGFTDKVPETWNGMDLQRYNLTGAKNYTLTWASYTDTFSIGGRNMKITWDTVWDGRIFLKHRYGFGLLWEEHLDWFNRDGVSKTSWAIGNAYLPSEKINEDYQAFGDIKFSVTCLGKGAGSSYFKMLVLFWFDKAVHPTPIIAWNNNALQILIGITMDYASTAIDAWYLVSSLLTFNTVEVFGNTAPESRAMNFILALPFLACIVIPAALFLLEVLDRIIPF